MQHTDIEPTVARARVSSKVKQQTAPTNCFYEKLASFSQGLFLPQASDFDEVSLRDCYDTELFGIALTTQRPTVESGGVVLWIAGRFRSRRLSIEACQFFGSSSYE